MEKVDWVSPVFVVSRLALPRGSGAPTSGFPGGSAVVEWGAFRAAGNIAWKEGLEKKLGARELRENVGAGPKRALQRVRGKSGGG